MYWTNDLFRTSDCSTVPDNKQPWMSMGVHVWKENGSYTVTYLADCIQVPAARDLAVPKKIKTWT